MTIEHRSQLKSALRSKMRKLLKGHDGQSNPVSGALETRLKSFASPQRIGIFAALPGEPDLSILPARLPQHQWHYPRVEGELLTLHPVVDPATQLVAGAFGILEPITGIPAAKISDMDVFICPGLAFDRHGGRLGRGRGYYDRLLAAARNDALKIGVGFSAQLVSDTFGEPHDIMMDEVICVG